MSNAPVMQNEPTTDSNPSSLVERQRQTLRTLLVAIAERARSESTIETTRSTSDSTADTEAERAGDALKQRSLTLEEDARKADGNRRRAIVQSALMGEESTKSVFARSSRKIAADFDASKERSRQDYQRDKSNVTSQNDAGENAAAMTFAKARKPIDDAGRITQAYESRLAALFEAYEKFGLKPPPDKPTRETYRFDDPVEGLFDRLEKVERPLKLVEGLVIPKTMKGPAFWPFIFIFALLLGPMIWLQEFLIGTALALVGALIFGYLIRTQLRNLSKTQVSVHYYPLQQQVVDAHALGTHCMALAQEKNTTERNRLATQRDEGLLFAKTKHTKALATAESVRDERLREINETYATRMVELRTKQQVDLREAIDTHDRRLKELHEQSETATRRLEEKYQEVKEKIHSRHATSHELMANRWREAMRHVTDELKVVTHEVAESNPSWDQSDPTSSSHASSVPRVLPMGQIPIDLNQLQNGVSPDVSLMESLSEPLPFLAIRAFPARANLVVSAPAAGRTKSIEALQAGMLRLLTSLPPGSVRFTLIDPIGIGRNFGAFMHLADFDDALVNGQVWTEPRQIEERLAELSAHMEKVAQKYLRNNYATIEEYNTAAGEVAESYRVVVIADFPAGFDEKSAARLAGIVTRGVPCGVLTMVAVDQDRPLPEGITYADLISHAETLTWQDDRLVWNDPDFGRFPVRLDAMPPADVATRLIQKSAKAARDVRRVVVPFEFIAPAPEAWWAGDSRAGIDIALGKSGPNKRQHLALGQGTSQHVLIAGRTGSGKSTLLHAMIANLALTYSPDEVDLYLIDFKKGVEFKVYATHDLPHASVIAIESEREFGISVLQRLDTEMRTRGDLFRDAGVQDLNGYRNVAGSPPLPRVLLIVDEFQEFFVEEDKLAQEAATLLDRLVRQGRAFGVHVTLGSQTLGGAFTLARATLGQMAIRIALQCSESDAYLILNEQNNAARLLSRPGEAVYNDANGMPEGNHFFQVVWLPDDRREVYLDQLQERARREPPKLKRSLIVFEGDTPAELGRNAKLKGLLDEPSWQSSPRSSTAWLGDPVAIKEPTAALFRRQGGNHLLIVGQNEESAEGVIAAAFLSLAAQYAPADSETIRAGAKFLVLDGTPEDHPRAEWFRRLTLTYPQQIEVGGGRDASRILTEASQEVVRRAGPDATDGPEIFMFIYDLARFRDLRKGEEDYSFSRSADDPLSPNDQLRYLLREGPSLGVHLVIWCDNLNNLNRIFDHQSLREFDMRVLFQMSQNDSGHFLDSPVASKLGPNRAMFASEEQNRLEKFRPYGFPSTPMLDSMRQHLASRV